MAARSSSLSKAPIRLDIADGRGDVLGDVLSLGLLRNVLYKQLEARAPWGMDVKARNRAMLYLIVRGQARLELDAHEPIVLAAGEAAFLPRGAAHVLRDSPTSPPSGVCDASRPRPGPLTRRIGGRGALTSIVAAFFELARAASPLLGRPAEVVVLPGTGGRGSPRSPIRRSTRRCRSCTRRWGRRGASRSSRRGWASRAPGSPRGSPSSSVSRPSSTSPAGG